MGLLRFLLRLPLVRGLHKRQLLFPTVVLIVVAAVLVQGSLDRVEPGSASLALATADPIPVPEPRPVLRADLEKTPLTYFSDYWNQLAEEASENLVAIGPSATPGILVGPRLALTTLTPALDIIEERARRMLTRPDPETGLETSGTSAAAGVASDASGEPASGVLAADGATQLTDVLIEEAGPYRLRAWDEAIGLALFDVPDAGETAFTLSDPRSLPTGSYLGAVTLNGAGEPTVTPGHLVSAGSGREGLERGALVVSMDLPATLTVAAVVNLDGALVGLAYASPEGTRVVTTTQMLGLIEALRTDTVCRSIEVSDLSAEVRRELGLDGGVLIEYLRREAFAPEPSLQPGDVLLEWGDTSLESTEQFEGVYDAQVPGSLVRYRVLRGSRRVTGGTLMPEPDCAPVTSEPVRLPRFGLAVQWLTPDASDSSEVASAGAWVVVAVAPDGPAAPSVQEGDRVLALGGDRVGNERDRSRFETAAQSDDTLLLSLRRADRAKLVAVMAPLESAEIRVPIRVDADGETTR